jgi:photosystem II stability/assembly factor-like uncharacterized protein
MRGMRALLLFLLFISSAEAQWWKVRTSGLDSNLRGVSVANTPDAKGMLMPVVWVSGSNGVILKSVDEGKTWKRLHVTGGEALDFRGIVAFDEKTAYVMSSGEGEKSRIYKTTDGGESWNLLYTDKRKEFFLDALKCVSEKECIALGDPTDGKFLLLRTEDGQRWNSLPSNNLPAALPGEAAFAASNTSLVYDDTEILFGTGGGKAARIFRSDDLGRTWTVVETPVAAGNASSGIFSLTRDENRVLVVGGDYKNPGRSFRAAAFSADEGKAWQLAAEQPGGYRSAVAQIDGGWCVAVGPNGEDFSDDYGAHWKRSDSLNLNSVAFLDVFTAWAVGPNGTIARFVNHKQYEIRYRHRRSGQQPAALDLAD